MKFDKLNDQFALRWAKKMKAMKLLGGKCVNCGVDGIFVLEFHHTGEKENKLADLFQTGARWSKIEKEI